MERWESKWHYQLHVCELASGVEDRRNFANFTWSMAYCWLRGRSPPYDDNNNNIHNSCEYVIYTLQWQCQ
jgi:hypothetical protein